MFPANYGVIRFLVFLEGYLATNVLHYIPNDTTPAVVASADDLQTSARTLLSTAVLDCLSNQCILFDITAQIISVEDSAYSDQAAINATGSLSGLALPNQDSVVFIKHLARLNGRLSRGRMFLSGCPENMVSVNNVVGALADNAAVLAGLLAQPITAVGTDWLPAVIRVVDGSYREVAAVSLQTEIRTQRRRRPLS